MFKSIALCVAMLFTLGCNVPTANNMYEQVELGIAEQETVLQVNQPSEPLTERERMEQMASRGEVRVVNMEISAYTASADECGNDAGITASGKRVQVGMVAAGKSYPFGTRLYIEGVGMVTIEDRGGAISDRHIDMYVETKEEAFKWGRQTRKVYILN